MQRVAIAKRENLSSRASETGLSLLEIDGEPYWDETACYGFSLKQIEGDLEDPTIELAAMCREQVRCNPQWSAKVPVVGLETADGQRLDRDLCHQRHLQNSEVSGTSTASVARRVAQHLDIARGDAAALCMVEPRPRYDLIRDVVPVASALLHRSRRPGAMLDGDHCADDSCGSILASKPKLCRTHTRIGNIALLSAFCEQQ
jgi:Glutathionylspermidine synthase preATP-grasp